MSVRPFSTPCVLVSLALASLMPLQAASGDGQPGLSSGQGSASARAREARRSQDPGEYYLTAYRLCRESEMLAQQQNYNAAIRKGQQAEKVLAVIVRDFPEWKSNLVSTRRRLLAENLETYRKKAAEAPIPTGRQPGKPLSTDVAGLELPGRGTTRPAPGSPGNYQPVELPDYQSTDKDLYNALARAQEECRRMAEAYKELNTRFLDVQKKLTVAQMNQQLYKERYDKLQEQIKSERAAGNHVVESLSRQLAELEEKYRLSEQARKEAEARAGELEARLAETQAELARVTKERDALKAENEQLRAIVELNSPEKTRALLDQNLTLAEQLKSAQERIQSLEAMQTGSDDQNVILSQQLDEARNEANRLREEMSGIYDENMGYRRRVSELTERLNNLEADLEAQAGRPVVDPALAEENRLLREVIAKQKRTIAMQEEGRRLLVETYKQIKNQDPEMLSALKKLDDESSLDLTDAERRMIDSVKKSDKEQNPTEGTDAVRRSLEIEALANLAARAFSRERYTSAEQLYRTLFDLQPDHVAGLVNLGAILLYRNKCEEGVEFLTRATRLAPDLAIGYYLAGICYYRLDRMAEAQRMFARTIELDPGNAEAFFYLANIEGVSGQYDRALKHFAAAVKLKPGLGDAHYNMARLYAETGKIPDASRAYDRAVHNGAEPDPEFENYLRQHPDNAREPGADLVEEVKPEDEAAQLRREDPEMARIVEANAGQEAGSEQKPKDEQKADGDAAGKSPEGAASSDGSDSTAKGEPADGGTSPASSAEPALAKLIARMEEERRETTSPSPAGAAHETDAARFSTVRVRARVGGSRHRVKLRLKRPEPQRLRRKGEEIRVVKPEPKPRQKRPRRRRR